MKISAVGVCDPELRCDVVSDLMGDDHFDARFPEPVAERHHGGAFPEYGLVANAITRAPSKPPCPAGHTALVNPCGHPFDGHITVGFPERQYPRHDLCHVPVFGATIRPANMDAIHFRRDGWLCPHPEHAVPAEHQ